MMMMKICLLISFIIAAVSAAIAAEDRKVFIAYMGSLPEGKEYVPSLHHYEILKQVTSPRLAREYLIRSYHKSFNGFAANLTQKEQQKLAGMDGIVSVFPSEKLKLQTTRSWDFMGFPVRTERSPTIESDIIVGVIDTGIWPESESFNDQGFGPIPQKWKGVCKGGLSFTCNRKLIGARFYGGDIFGSALDENGHGTHVASTVAGNHVSNANYYGLAQGTARGGVPSARLAVYKVCNDSRSCNEEHIMTAFDDAIADGVDIISISINKKDPVALTSDPIAIGAFHGIEKGVLTVHAGGNYGPGFYSIKSHAPWIFTVAASDIDRRIVDKVLLGDATTLVGNSINSFPSSQKELPLVYGKQVTSNCTEAHARACRPQCLESSLVQQKLVVCDDISVNAVGIVINALKDAGAFGCIIPDMGNNYSRVWPLPVAALTTNGMSLTKAYLKSTKTPTAKILKSEAINNPAAPLVASFSSRGPSIFISDIIKPDVTAPGVEILAAYSPWGSPSESQSDKRSVTYSILSGTSMACPHVAGAAAYVKSFHPDWSPSAIKSALMTTAWETDPYKNMGAEFAYGSGHIHPYKAKDPGLVYETFKDEYVKIGCNIALNVTASCPAANLNFKDLNYPSMAVQVDVKSAFNVTFPRTVTNVGRANSSYVASIKGTSKLLHITVDPNHLQFTELNQKKSFLVTVKGKGIKRPESGSLLWTDGIHNVRSPILVYTGTSTRLGFCKPFVILFLTIFL